MSVQVGANSFIATLKSHVDGPNCQLTLDDLKVSELSDMKVELSGFHLFGHIVTWFMDYLSGVIVEITDTHSKDMVNHVIKDKRICEELFEDEIADRPTTSFIGSKPFAQIETLSTKAVHEKVRTSGGYYPESTHSTLLRLTMAKTEKSKIPHRKTTNESDKVTTPFLQEDPQSTPQVSSSNIPSHGPSEDILDMIDDIPSMSDH